MTVKSSARVGYLNAILAQGGGNLNNSIFKSSNARGLPGGGGGGLMFRIDRRIKVLSHLVHDAVLGRFKLFVNENESLVIRKDEST